MAQRYALESTNWITLTEQLTDGSLIPWHPEFNHFMMEKYTTQNVYWLTVGGTGGPCMSIVDGDPSGSTAPIPLTYHATVHAELELRRPTAIAAAIGTAGIRRDLRGCHVLGAPAP